MSTLATTLTMDLNVDSDFPFAFGSPFSLFTDPFTVASESPTLSSVDSTESASSVHSDHLNRPTTLGSAPSEQAAITELDFDWTTYHTHWPAFHWDEDALENHAREFYAESGDADFEFDVDLYLESRKVYDLEGEQVGIVVGPRMDSIQFFGFGSNSGIAVVAPNPPIVDDSEESSDGVVVNVNIAEILSDDIQGEDIPRYGTPDFKILRPSPVPSNDSPTTTNIRRLFPLLYSEASSFDFYSAAIDINFDFESEWSFFRSFSEFTRASSPSGFTSFGVDSPLFDIGSGVIDIGESEAKRMIGSSLVALLDSAELDNEWFQAQDVFSRQTGDLDGVEGEVIYSTSGQNASVSLSPEASSGASNPDVTLVKGPIDLVDLSTVPIVGDPSLQSTCPILPLVESEPTDILGRTYTPSRPPQAELEAYFQSLNSSEDETSNHGYEMYEHKPSSLRFAELESYLEMLDLSPEIRCQV